MRAKSLLAIALLCGSCSVIHRDPPLPDLPAVDMAKFLPAVRERIQPAYDAVRAHPKDAAANGSLGMLLEAHEQYQAAEVCYQRAHLLDSRSFRWAYYLGSVRALQGRDPAGALRDGLALDPDYAPARLKLAEALLSGGKLAESEQAYRTILKAQPENAAAWYGLGRIYAARGEQQGALESYRRACDLFPNYGAAQYALALAYRKQGNIGESDRRLQMYERNKTALPPLDDPLSAEVRELNAGALSHIRRAAALERAGRIEDAIAEHETALQIDPKLAQAHVNLISLYGRLGQFDKACRHYREAVSLDPKQADSYYNYGVLLFERKDYSEAKQAFEHALRINPYHAQAHNNLGYLLEQQGRLEQALAHYDKAIESQPDYRMAHFHAGRILANQRKYQEAIAHFLKTIGVEDERTPACLYALAAAYARSHQRENALLYARRAREGAAARGQTELLAGIDKDLAVLERQGNRP